MRNLGAQLYTVRDKLTDYPQILDTLQAIRDIGYTSVQLFGAPELLKSCAQAAFDTGLAITGVLGGMNICENYEKELFALCADYSIPDIGISSSFPVCQNPDAYIQQVNAFAKKARAAGFSFSYHNHGHEFIRLPSGYTPMERFLQGFDRETVDFMPDTYWLHDGGCDVRHFLEQTKGRVKILHLKDLMRTEQGHTYAEVGNGNLYFKGILQTALACGITDFIVEQDECAADPLDSLAVSYRNAKALLEVL